MRSPLLFLVSSTALIAATYGLARFGYGLFIPSFRESFEFSTTTAGGISSGSFLSYCCAAALAYSMAAAPQRIVFLAGATATAGSIGVACANSTLMLAISMLVAGAGAGFASPGLVALVQEKIKPAATARAQTLVNAGTGFGIVLAGPLALLLTQQWRTAWWIIAVINAGATVAVLSTAGQSSLGSAKRRGVSIGRSDVGRLRLAAVAAALAGIASAAVWTFGKSWVSEQGHMSELSAGMFWILLGAAGIAGAFSGHLVERWAVRKSWAVGALSMAAATLALGLWPSHSVAVYVAGAVFGGSYVALTGVLIIWASQVAPGQEAAGTAALFITLAVGQAAGSFLFGVLLELSNPTLVFVLAAILAGGSAVPAMLNTRADAVREVVADGRGR